MSDLSKVPYRRRLERAKRLALSIIEDGIKIPEQIDGGAIKQYINENRINFNMSADVKVADSELIHKEIARHRCWEPASKILKLHSYSSDPRFKDILHRDSNVIHKHSGYDRKLWSYVDDLLTVRLGALRKAEITLKLSLCRALFDNTEAAKTFMINGKWMGTAYAFRNQIVSFSEFLMDNIFYKIYENSMQTLEKSTAVYLAEAFSMGLGFVLV